jgi:hypothetical protein
MRTSTSPFVRWSNIVLALLMTLTVMASASTRSTAGTPSPERLDTVEWGADCSVSYRLTPSNPEAVSFVRVRYWAYDAVRQRGSEMDAPGHTLNMDAATRGPLEGTLAWQDTGPTTRLYVYVSSFDRQGRSIGSTTSSGICQPKT